MINLDPALSRLQSGECATHEIKKATADRTEQFVNEGDIVSIFCTLCRCGESGETINIAARNLNNDILWSRVCDTSCLYDIPFTETD